MFNFPEKAKRVVTTPIPDSIIQTRPGGGNVVLSYISGTVVIDLLNEAFNYLWDWEVVREWVQPSEDKYNPKYDSAPKAQAPVAHVLGKLTVYFPDEEGKIFHKICKTAYGSKIIVGGQMDQEHIFKSAGTDAMKKAASLFGIGLELARNEDEQGLFLSLNEDNPWTDEMLEKYRTERNYIKTYMKECNIEVDALNEIISDFSEGEYTEIENITPDNISEFVEYLKESIIK